jgi:hypothetical protein
VHYVESGFFPCLAEGSLCRRFASINVSTWLQPHVEPLVQMQDNTALAHNNSGSSDVRWVGHFVKWFSQRWHQVKKLGD